MRRARSVKRDVYLPRALNYVLPGRHKTWIRKGSLTDTRHRSGCRFAVGEMLLLMCFLLLSFRPVQGSDWVYETCDFNDVWGSASSDIYAVGNRGVIRRFEGHAWKPVDLNLGPCATSFLFNGVWGSSASDVYVVGCYGNSMGDGCTAQGLILHYDGADWRQEPVEDLPALKAVWGSGPTDIFAVGGSTILHYDGIEWSPMASGTTEYLMALWGSAGADVFAMGTSGTILHYNGGAWAPMVSGTTENLRGVWGLSGSDVFAVGDNGTVIHYDGSDWTPFPTSEDMASLPFKDVWGTGSTNFYVVGNSGIVFRYGYGGWGNRIDAKTDRSLKALWGSSHSNIIAAGSASTIVGFNGSWWTLRHGGTTERLFEVWGSSATDIFAVGNNGTVLHNDGNGWKPMASGTDDKFYSVWGTSASDVWAVGCQTEEGSDTCERGRAYHYNGSSWAQDTGVDFDGELAGVWGSAANNFYAVGDYPTGSEDPPHRGGCILHYDGGSWSRVNYPEVYSMLGLWGNAADDIYAVGNNFEGAYHFDGGAWTFQEIDSDSDSNAKYDMWGNALGELFTVGVWTETLKNHPENHDFRNGVWSQTPIDLPDGFPPARPFSVWGRSDHDIVAAGYTKASGCYGQFILRFGGEAWWIDRQSCGEPELWGIWGTGDGTLYAVGDQGAILRLPADDPTPTPVEPWTQWYGGEATDVPAAIEPTADGGSVVAGNTESYGAGDKDIWVIKLDPSGFIEWQKTYGGADADFATAIKPTLDGGYILAGTTASFGAGGTDVWLLKLDEYGEVQWQKTYGEGYDDMVSDMLVEDVCQGGYVLVGNTWFGEEETDGWVLKLDRDGEPIWKKTYGTSGTETLKSIAATKGFGYVISGKTDSLSQGYGDYWVLRLDGDGDVLWQKQFGLYSFVPPEHYNYHVEEAAHVRVGKDGGILLAGRSEPPELNAFAWVVKFDPFGNVVWEQTVRPVWETNVTSIAPTSDNGCVVSGYIILDTSGSAATYEIDGWMAKLDEDGSVEWQRAFGGLAAKDRDRIVSAGQAADSGYLAAGYSQRSEGPEPDFWVLRLNGEGNIPDCGALSPWHGGQEETFVDGLVTSVVAVDTVPTALVPTGVTVTETETSQADACYSAIGDIIDLAQTGQTSCYDQNAQAIACQDSGQDGEVRAGVAWPSPRFTDNGDGTVTDELTGLMWLKDANCAGSVGHDPAGQGPGLMSWWSALDFVASINAGMDISACSSYTAPYRDWRLANINEMETLIHYGVQDPVAWLAGQGFVNIPSESDADFWSSTTHGGESWLIKLHWARLYNYPRTSLLHAWPVRAGRFFHPDPAFPANTWKTGQTESLYPGDDGALQTGVAWPSPRFTVNGDGTVTDRLTGLMWLQDTRCMATSYPEFDNDYNAGDGEVTWQHALDFVAGINDGTYPDCGAGYTDWHLPNNREFLSLIDRGERLAAGVPSFPSDHPFLGGEWNHAYWSATNPLAPGPPATAWGLIPTGGDFVAYNKTYNHSVWPVRGAPKCKGDLDGDGDVDGADLVIFAEDLDRTDCCEAEAPPCEGDLVEDCLVDDADVNAFSADFGRTDCPEVE